MRNRGSNVMTLAGDRFTAVRLETRSSSCSTARKPISPIGCETVVSRGRIAELQGKSFAEHPGTVMQFEGWRLKSIWHESPKRRGPGWEPNAWSSGCSHGRPPIPSGVSRCPRPFECVGHRSMRFRGCVVMTPRWTVRRKRARFPARHRALHQRSAGPSNRRKKSRQREHPHLPRQSRRWQRPPTRRCSVPAYSALTCSWGPRGG
jgi:hypothetical protein